MTAILSIRGVRKTFGGVVAWNVKPTGAVWRLSRFCKRVGVVMRVVPSRALIIS